MSLTSSTVTYSLSAAGPRSDAAGQCYHCRLPLPREEEFQTEFGGVSRCFCCAGCLAVATMIHESGLEAFYAQRTRPSSKAEPVREDWTLFDRPAVQQSFVRALGDGEMEALLGLDGLVCGACAWLNEQHLRRLPGVVAAEVNLAAQRLRVRWQASRLRLSEIFAAIAALGYRAAPYDAQREEAQQKSARRGLLWRLGVAGLGMMQVMMYAYPAYVTDDGLGPQMASLLRWASLILALPVVLFSASPFFAGAWRDLSHRRFGMDVPVALALAITFLASAWSTWSGQGEVYFDALTMFVFLLLGSRYFELRARQRAAARLRFSARPLPLVCTRLVAEGKDVQTERVAVAELSVGDRILVAPGETIPADALVLEGSSRVEEAQLTGEFWPVARAAGQTVFAGSLNRQAPLTLRVQAVGAGTRWWAIGRLVDRALASRPRLARLADRIAGRFVAVQLILAALVTGLWVWLDPSRAFEVLVAVLVVSCPCALSLAAPMALAVATGGLARRGLLVTGGDALETLARSTDIVFDKTGTLSIGRPALRECLALGDLSSEAVLELAAQLEAGSRHPLAEAFRRAGATLPENWREVPGAGVEGTIAGRVYRLGCVAWVAALAGAPPPVLPSASAGASLLGLGGEAGWLSAFVLDDAPRADAGQALRDLAALGLRLHLVSGDRPETVASWAEALGIGDFAGGSTPEGKQDYVRALQAGGETVLMVGDGVNDTPGFAQAQVSVALASGAALARHTADIVLLRESLLPLARGVLAARRCLKVMRQNLAWAFAYNALAIPLAALGWMPPWLAALGMAGSSLLVVANAGRLARERG